MQLRNNPAGLTASSIPDDVNDWGCRFVDSGQGRTTVVGAEYTHPSPRSRSHYEPEFTRIRPYIKVSPQKKWCLGVDGGCYLVSVEGYTLERPSIGVVGVGSTARRIQMRRRCVGNST